jgi:hypothetical protein
MESMQPILSIPYNLKSFIMALVPLTFPGIWGRVRQEEGAKKRKAA